METVINCTKTKDWLSPKTGQPIPIYAIGLSDGRGGQSFGKEIPVGTPINDLVITSSQYGLDIKWNKPGQGAGFQKSSRGGNESFALSYAKDLVIGGKVELKSILTTAEKLYGWLESKKAPIAVTASPPEQKSTPQTTAQASGLPNDDLPF